MCGMLMCMKSGSGHVAFIVSVNKKADLWRRRSWCRSRFHGLSTDLALFKKKRASE